MNIDDLKHDPQWLEGSRHRARYLIDERDRGDDAGESEWFCRHCGEQLEDEFELCTHCRFEGPVTLR